MDPLSQFMSQRKDIKSEPSSLADSLKALGDEIDSEDDDVQLGWKLDKHGTWPPSASKKRKREGKDDEKVRPLKIGHFHTVTKPPHLSASDFNAIRLVKENDYESARHKAALSRSKAASDYILLAPNDKMKVQVSDPLMAAGIVEATSAFSVNQRNRSVRNLQSTRLHGQLKPVVRTPKIPENNAARTRLEYLLKHGFESEEHFEYSMQRIIDRKGMVDFFLESPLVPRVLRKGTFVEEPLTVREKFAITEADVTNTLSLFSTSVHSSLRNCLKDGFKFRELSDEQSCSLQYFFKLLLVNNLMLIRATFDSLAENAATLSPTDAKPELEAHAGRVLQLRESLHLLTGVLWAHDSQAFSSKWSPDNMSAVVKQFKVLDQKYNLALPTQGIERDLKVQLQDGKPPLTKIFKKFLSNLENDRKKRSAPKHHMSKN